VNKLNDTLTNLDNQKRRRGMTRAHGTQKEQTHKKILPSSRQT